jgi:hypothetical protein
MGKKQLTIENTVTVRGLSIIPIVKNTLEWHGDNGQWYCLGAKEPYAVVIKQDLVFKVVTMVGKEISISELNKKMPDDIKKILTKLVMPSERDS